MTTEEFWSDVFSIIYKDKRDGIDSTITVERIKALLYDNDFKIFKNEKS